MAANSEKKYTLILILLMLVFAALFFIALGDLNQDVALFNIGIPALFENWLIMILSIGSIVRIIYELTKN
ncbi:MAG TPA: hypothetical protein VEC16_01125 [Alphaproteobacteria bacterium]|nr:hypothetical protein [Alphaproteobacteria bacterium]